MTWREREANKKLWEELQEKRENGEGWYIKRGKLMGTEARHRRRRKRKKKCCNKS